MVTTAKHPQVSVVMSVYNCQRFLREAVESILSQSFGDFEFIIIDDGSTDECGRMLDRYATRDSRIRVHHQTNRGLIASLNTGCRLARGKYIARMDADDVAIKNRLMRQVQYMETHPSVAVLGGAVERIDAEGNGLGIYRHPCTSSEIKMGLIDRSMFWHPTVLIRKDVLDSAGGYRSMVLDAEDYDLWLRLAERFELANLDSVVLKYRLHPGQISVRKCEQEALSSLAARASASARRSHGVDPIDTICAITPETLISIGISESDQGLALARHWLTCIRHMYEAGELSAVYTSIKWVRSRYIQYAARWVINDLRLVEAKLLWRERHFVQSILAYGMAITNRPVILARPLRSLLAYISRFFTKHRIVGGTVDKFGIIPFLIGRREL